MVNCPICNKNFKQLHGTHIKTHNLTTQDFKQLYPNVSLRNETGYKISQEKSRLLDIQVNNRCKTCNKLLTGSYRKVKKFCNSSCSASWTNKKRFEKLKTQFVVNVCQHCKKEYKVLKYRSTISKFCCTKCSSKSRSLKRIPVNCNYCNMSVLKSAHAINSSEFHFCNNICKNAFFTGTSKYRGIYAGHNGKSVVSSYRKEAFQVYDNKCAHCGFNKYITVLQVHHIDGNRKNNDIKNLKILCPTCHAAAHQGLISILPG